MPQCCFATPSDRRARLLLERVVRPRGQVVELRHAAGDASARLNSAGKSKRNVTDDVSSFVNMDSKLPLGSGATAGIGPAGAANLAFRLPALEKSPSVKVNPREPGLPGLPGSVDEPEIKVRRSHATSQPDTRALVGCFSMGCLCLRFTCLVSSLFVCC